MEPELATFIKSHFNNLLRSLLPNESAVSLSTLETNLGQSINRICSQTTQEGVDHQLQLILAAIESGIFAKSPAIHSNIFISRFSSHFSIAKADKFNAHQYFRLDNILEMSPNSSPPEHRPLFSASMGKKSGFISDLSPGGFQTFFQHSTILHESLSYFSFPKIFNQPLASLSLIHFTVFLTRSLNTIDRFDDRIRKYFENTGNRNFSSEANIEEVFGLDRFIAQNPSFRSQFYYLCDLLSRKKRNHGSNGKEI